MTSPEISAHDITGAPGPLPRSRMVRTSQRTAARIVLAVGLAALSILPAPLLRDMAFAVYQPRPLPDSPTAARVTTPDEIRRLQAHVSAAEHQLAGEAPDAVYLVVCTSDNTFELRRKNDILRKGSCSTGSFTLLKSSDPADRSKTWMFTTPRGMFRVQAKETDPVWCMPDWAFVEEGRPIPGKGAPERFVKGVLGDYALHLGQGYMIHGTLYQRFLGLAVTHGCVRLADDDLKAVYEGLTLGARVYMY